MMKVDQTVGTRVLTFLLFFSVAVPLTLEKREDLLKKRENFKKNADQLDDQLMKLKVWIIHLKGTV
jgi:hypothetical protein